MSAELKLAIAETLRRGSVIGELFREYEFSKGPNQDRCAIISNPRTRKAGLIYHVLPDPVLYFLLSFRKLNWLETEGWSLTEIMSKLPREVLKEVTLEELPYELSIEGD